MRLTLKARQLLQNSVYDPAQLKLLYEAFDAAWEQVKNNFGPELDTIESARIQLASAVLSFAQDDSQDAAGMADRALKILGWSR
jgi:hypothetical protein